MEALSFPYKHSVMAYYRFGNGAQPVICFHGYGEDASHFEFLGKEFGGQFSFLCVDLPFHGKTVWKDELIFTEDDLKAVVEEVLKREGIRETQLYSLGFSLGGRVALSLYQALPDKVSKLLLFAPDGLKVNFWYWLSTQTWLGNKFFHFTMTHPRWFFWFVKVLHKIRLVNTSIFKFVNYYVDDKQARDWLYDRWTTLRKLKPGLHHIKGLVNKQSTPVRLVYGQHDRIILSSVGEKFRKGIEANCKITVIATGHQVLQPKHMNEIRAALMS